MPKKPSIQVQVQKKRIDFAVEQTQIQTKISPTSVADAALSSNKLRSAEQNFPPLPKHLTREAGTNYTPPPNGKFAMAVSSLTGTISTGAANDAHPLPKLMPDGAHDRDDAFITCVF